VAPFSLLPFAAGFFSLLLAVASVLRKKPSVATWCFFAGMAALGIDSVCIGLSLRATQLGTVVDWLTRSFIFKSLATAAWLGFSLTYSRGNYREFLTSWRIPLTLLGLLPIGLSLGFRGQLFQAVSAGTPDGAVTLQFGVLANVLNIVLLIAFVLILMNLEQTFRSAVGTMRWRIKFVILALAVIFGARLYVRIQALLFSVPDIALWSVDSGALLIGCFFLALAYARTGWAEIDVYPSLSVLRSSLTALIVGGYLFIVGVLAQLVRRFGGAEIFQFQAFVVLLGMAGLAVLLLSDRARQRIHTFVVRHFRKAQHDSVRIWTLFSRQLANVNDEAGLCAMSARLIAENFDVLSVTIWLLDAEKGRLIVGASTARQHEDALQGLATRPAIDGKPMDVASDAVTAGARARFSPFNLEDVHEAWAEEFRQLNPTTFPNGGNRWCIPLRAAEHTLGLLVLSDRVSGIVYTVEELELLKCIGDHVTSVLLNVRLAGEVAQAKELEAFRTMSAFFVHDLKNAASSLNLTLKNLPVHFEDPAFRADALRGVGNAARRVDETIARLSALRQRPQLTPVEADLNQLVSEALDRINGVPNVQLTRELQPLPKVVVDREQIQSVVTNLVLNARDALGSGGRIAVHTQHRDGRAVLSVVDNGCGMSQAFLKESLFRPFKSTKNNGLGIGLFQSRAIVLAHGGGMHVESEAGKGTTILVTLPVQDRK
jgi:putative PEP-CTERM system histidine kinase